MKKNGFTLAEVLITLGLIGVIAALAVPALVSSTRNASYAASLAVNAGNLENAFTTAIAKEHVNNIFQTRMWRSINNGMGTTNCSVGPDDAWCPQTVPTDEIRQRFAGELGRYMAHSGVILGNNPTQNYYGDEAMHPMDANGGTNTAFSVQTIGGGGYAFPIKLKNGAVLLIRTYGQPTPYSRELIQQKRAAGTNYIYNAADIVIDVNGNSRPNTYGRDIFWFQVGENGILYPVGGLDVAVTDSDSKADQAATQRWDNPESVWACIGKNFGTEDWGRGIGCTARVIADGYKITY